MPANLSADSAEVFRDFDLGGRGARKAFLLQGDNVFLASAGDVVDRKYRVVSITANSILVEDIPNVNKQTLPLMSELSGTRFGDARGTQSYAKVTRSFAKKSMNREQGQSGGDEGFVLLMALVMVFLVLLALTIAAPRIAKSIQRDREVEATHRAEQYVRAIRVYHKKFNNYPSSVEQLEKSNNQRFLRQKYLDPLTGKDDWRIIHVGENKTTVKGFFGQDLPGLGGGLNAGGLQSGGTGQTTAGTGNGTGGNSSIGGTQNTGSNSTGSSVGTGIGSQDAASATGGGGGPIMGIGSSATGEAMVTVNEQTNYQDWEFLYDPKIEQLYAKGSLLGGPPTSGTGLGTGTSSLPGTTTTTPAPQTQQQ